MREEPAETYVPRLERARAKPGTFSLRDLGIAYFVRKPGLEANLLIPSRKDAVLPFANWKVSVDPARSGKTVDRQVERIASMGYDLQALYLDEWLHEIFGNGWQHAAKGDTTQYMDFSRQIRQGHSDLLTIQVDYPGEGFDACAALEHAVRLHTDPTYAAKFLLKPSGRGLFLMIGWGAFTGYSADGTHLLAAYDLGKPVLREVTPDNL